MMAIIEDTDEDWECFVHYGIPLHILGNMKILHEHLKLPRKGTNSEQCHHTRP